MLQHAAVHKHSTLQRCVARRPWLVSCVLCRVREAAVSVGYHDSLAEQRTSAQPAQLEMDEQHSSKRRKTDSVKPLPSSLPPASLPAPMQSLSSPVRPMVDCAARPSSDVHSTASSSAVGPRRLFTNVQVVVWLEVQADGGLVTRLQTRQSSKAERRVERRDRKFELLHANRQYKRREAKQKRRQQRQQQANDTHAQQAASTPAVKRGRLFREWVRSRQSSSPVVCIDCQWEAAMVETEVQSLSKQLKFLYADNMHAQHPLRIALTSYGRINATDERTAAHAAEGEQHCSDAGADMGMEGVQAPRLYTYMARIEGFDRWLLDRSPLHFRHVFAAQSASPTASSPQTVIYLTAESPTLLTRLQPNGVYVIGALVDHNRLPGMCHSAAVAESVATARLPITECMRVDSGSRRTVITVNQVFHCLLMWWNMREELQQKQGSEEAQPWQLRWAAAFGSALPKRGGWRVREEWSAAISQPDERTQQSDCPPNDEPGTFTALSS